MKKILLPQVWCLVLEGGDRGERAYVSEEEDFEVDPLWNREPVEALEDRGDVFRGVGVGEQASGRVLVNWTLFRALDDVPLRMMLEYWILDVNKAWIKDSAAEKENDGYTQAIFLRWKKAVLLICLSLCSNKRLLSQMTTRLWMWAKGDSC